MAVKICRKCSSPKTVQPISSNRISYWICTRCSFKCVEEKPKKLLPLYVGKSQASTNH